MNAPGRLGQRTDGTRVSVYPGYEDFALLVSPADRRDSRISEYLILKGVGPVHFDHGLDGETSRRDELTKTGTVLVEHPAVGADEGAHASWCEHLQRSLE